MNRQARRQLAAASLDGVPSGIRDGFPILVRSDLFTWQEAIEMQHERAERYEEITDPKLAIDLTLYAMAVRQTLRAAELGADIGLPGFDAALSDFNQSVPLAKDARDVLDHFDEYRLGIGNLQGAGLRNSPKFDYNPFLERGIGEDGEPVLRLHIGGHLNVEMHSTTKAARRLIDQVIESEEAERNS